MNIKLCVDHTTTSQNSSDCMPFIRLDRTKRVDYLAPRIRQRESNKGFITFRLLAQQCIKNTV